MGNLILKRIEKLNDSFTPSEKKVADFIMENYERVPNMTIKQLAEEANTSNAAVIRFLKTADIPSFGTLKMHLFHDNNLAKNNSEDLLKRIEEADSSKEIFKKIANLSKKSIDDTLAFLNFSDFDKALDIISSSRKILICGVGASGAVGSDLHLKFLKINLPVVFSFDVHVQMTTAINMNEDDCIIVISTSGRSREMIEIINIANDNKTPIISITQFGKSPVANKSTVNLSIASNETSMRIGTMGARIAELTVIDTMFTCLCHRDVNNYMDYVKKTSRVMDNLKYKE